MFLVLCFIPGFSSLPSQDRIKDLDDVRRKDISYFMDDGDLHVPNTVLPVNVDMSDRYNQLVMFLVVFERQTFHTHVRLMMSFGAVYAEGAECRYHIGAGTMLRPYSTICKVLGSTRHLPLKKPIGEMRTLCGDSSLWASA